MKSTKRHLCLLLCVVMVLGLFSGCGGQGEETQPSASTTEAATTPTTVPETTTAPTEPLVLLTTAREFQENIDQELLARGVPYTLELVQSQSYDRMAGILQPTGDGAVLPDNLYIDLILNASTNEIRYIGTVFYYRSDVDYDPLTPEQQSQFLELAFAISKAYDPTCNDEALAAMINVMSMNLTEISEQYEFGQEIFDDVILYYDTNYTQTEYNNKAEDVKHSIEIFYDGDSLSSIYYVVSSTLDQSSQVASVNKDVSACITIAELETLLNETFADLGFPLEVTFSRGDIYRGRFETRVVYNGEYADVETNKMINDFKSLFGFSAEATDIWEDSLVRSVRCSLLGGALEEFKDHPEYVEIFTNAFEEITLTVASALDGQAHEDMLAQVSSATPYDIWENTYNGVTSTYVRRSGVFSGLFCDYGESTETNLVYPSISYTLDVIDLMSDEFDPYIPHGDEVNEPKYLDYEIQFGEWVMSPEDYIPYIRKADQRSFVCTSDFFLGTYSPISTYTVRYGPPMEDDFSNLSILAFNLSPYTYAMSEYGLLDQTHYRVYEFTYDYGSVEDIKHLEVHVYYNTNYTEYFPQEYLDAGLDPEYALRVPIAYSLIADEGMTAEEVYKLLVEGMEPTDTWRDYQVTVYCPRDVMHILLENPETGGHQYWLVDKARFDEHYGDLITFLDMKAESEYYIDP